MASGSHKTTAQLLRKLNTPGKIQDFLNTLRMRTVTGEPIVRSPFVVAQSSEATCMEGALLAIAALSWHGHSAWLLDLKVDQRANDVDHVVALFKQNGCYGAISKTNHGVLRYREPIYRTVRELALSYFHEYFTDDGKKTLRSYSKPYDVFKKHGESWVDSQEDLYAIACELDESKHENILPKGAVTKLRLADTVEIAAGKLKEWE